ncbi:MAG: Mov34/MPN/PAD-1 family protein [Verrucomicrobiota bacterium]|nr:Mov34/MPN/PAD-1 family protein [Verrucomicrobiota bacterium]
MADQDDPLQKIQWRPHKDTFQPAPAELGVLAARYGIEPLGQADSPPQSPQVWFEHDTMRKIRRHLGRDLERELGGLLYGEVFHDPTLGLHIVIVWEALMAEQAEGSPVHIRYNEESWENINRQKRLLDPAWNQVGNYHSHPGLGVFLSGTDLANQRAFFPESWQVALVLDPVAGDEGIWAGPQGTPLDGYRLFSRKYLQ